MRRKTGILHVYSKPSKPRQIHLVGDEEGLYRLWETVGEAMLSRTGRAGVRLSLGDGRWQRVHILRVDGKTAFLKNFPPVR